MPCHGMRCGRGDSDRAGYRCQDSVLVDGRADGQVAVAAIPALIVMVVAGAVASMVMAALFGGGVHHWEMSRWWIR